ncbi:hypothetical protein EV702DRAFT_455190 [Suillus placidus]|uniref:DUF6533 domain-containing protein n=1 Tax=Suillus placidus TaxID=48579 RepID=A0A9P6ZSY4_9AGAM|nr:hypothetical protein EV702DRAFT_455190 [Suillus placidus]
MSRSNLDGGFAVAASAGVTYDWALTLGQEVELIWRQRWSLMTVLYLSVRYLGILYAVVQILFNVPTVSVTDVVSWILHDVLNWTNVVVFAMLGVIMITRLHAMYQQSRKILIFLAITFLADNIYAGVVATMYTRHTSGEELILSGTHQCTIAYAGDTLLLGIIAWILCTAWEVLALCLAVWIASKHFRELGRRSAGRVIGDCFLVLMKSHVLYFASSVAASCFEIGYISPTISADQSSLETRIYAGFLKIFTVGQLFVLGPRLILGVREYHAKLVVDSDATTSMNSIAFQERVHITTGSGV